MILDRHFTSFASLPPNFKKMASHLATVGISVAVFIVILFVIVLVVPTAIASANYITTFAGLSVLTCFFIFTISRCKKFDDNRLHREFLTFTMERFLNDLERESPTRLTSFHLMRATNNYSNMLGSGSFGSVYKGTFSDGTNVAVKVLRGSIFDKRMEEQFMAEVGTMGKVRHLNIVRLIGFCIEKNITALVYEYMSNGSLDKYLFSEHNKTLTFEKLHSIALETAIGIAYLHEEYQERIIHYDIKPENILLDDNWRPKVADFCLAKICKREKSYVTMTGLRGTPGYTAPELWMPIRVTQKCDVYSFGIMLFEIIGRRRHFDVNLSESQQWFPRWVWVKFESQNLEYLINQCAIEDKNKEMVERMIRIALWCIQYRPELRPKMSDVVKMLEGVMDILNPSNPFQQLMEENHGNEATQMDSNTDNVLCTTPEGTESSVLEIQIYSSQN